MEIDFSQAKKLYLFSDYLEEESLDKKKTEFDTSEWQIGQRFVSFFLKLTVFYFFIFEKLCFHETIYEICDFLKHTKLK